uniref:Putative secreted peptide n=1 Tax=Anopheles braziliensis TaxID=58242 RepID=A0A2M3ZQN4_9DIPT
MSFIMFFLSAFCTSSPSPPTAPPLADTVLEFSFPPSRAVSVDVSPPIPSPSVARFFIRVAERTSPLLLDARRSSFGEGLPTMLPLPLLGTTVSVFNDLLRSLAVASSWVTGRVRCAMNAVRTLDSSNDSTYTVRLISEQRIKYDSTFSILSSMFPSWPLLQTIVFESFVG